MNKKIIWIILAVILALLLIYNKFISINFVSDAEHTNVSSYTTYSNCVYINSEIKCKCNIVLGDEEERYEYNNTLSGDDCDICSKLCKDYAESLVKQ